jgi:hypothetical protein
MLGSKPIFCRPIHVKVYAAFGETFLFVDYAIALLTLSFDDRK